MCQRAVWIQQPQFCLLCNTGYFSASLCEFWPRGWSSHSFVSQVSISNCLGVGAVWKLNHLLALFASLRQLLWNKWSGLSFALQLSWADAAPLRALPCVSSLQCMLWKSGGGMTLGKVPAWRRVGLHFAAAAFGTCWPECPEKPGLWTPPSHVECYAFFLWSLLWFDSLLVL